MKDLFLKCKQSFNKLLDKAWIYNPGENVWGGIEKSSKTGQDKKSFISPFACSLTATAKV